MSGLYRGGYGDLYRVVYVASRDEYFLENTDHPAGVFISEADLLRQIEVGWLTKIS